MVVLYLQARRTLIEEQNHAYEESLAIDKQKHKAQHKSQQQQDTTTSTDEVKCIICCKQPCSYIHDSVAKEKDQGKLG